MNYNTTQKNLLSRFFSTHAESLFTIDEIAESLPDVGRSTIYRLVAKAEKEGTLRRLETGRGETPFYQYLGLATCDSHLHLVCTRCGRFSHLDESLTEKIGARLEEEAGFRLSPTLTTIYGLCEKCRKEEK
jgi:Fe2+/Zn2+ uptake regulation proteins